MEQTAHDSILGPDGQPYRRGRRRIQLDPVPVPPPAAPFEFEPFEFTALKLSDEALELAAALGEMTTVWSVTRTQTGWASPGKAVGPHEYPTEVKAIEDAAGRMIYGLVADQKRLGKIRVVGDGPERAWLVDYGEPRQMLPQPVVQTGDADGYTLAVLDEYGQPFARAFPSTEIQ